MCKLLKKWYWLFRLQGARKACLWILKWQTASSSFFDLELSSDFGVSTVRFALRWLWSKDIVVPIVDTEYGYRVRKWELTPKGRRLVQSVYGWV